MADKKYVDSAGLGAVRDWADDKFQPKLPEISATDNGKVLSVVEGQWAPTELQEELPEVTSADNGKVLAVVAGEWEKAEAPDGLPPVQSADNGKVLTVVEGEWAKADVPDELPAVSASDNGKVLSVVQGAWAKATPEDELPEVSASDNGKFLGVVNGAWGKADVDALPAVTSQDNGKVMVVENGEWGAGEVDALPPVTTQDNGKVLGVVAGAWAKTEPEDGLPEVTSSDNGKVLSVVEGAWAPAVPSGGSGLPEVTSADNGDLLSVVNGAWAKSEPGYRVERSEAEIAPEQSVTTAAQGPYIFGQLTATVPDPLPDSVNVTFNGTNYENVPKHADETLGAEVYGDIAFTEYPFVIGLIAENSALFTQAAGTYTVKVASPPSSDVIPTEDFKLAVNNSYMETTETEQVAIPEQSVTTEARSGSNRGYTQDYTELTMDTAPETLRVTWNGTEYTVPLHDSAGDPGYGEFDGEGNPVFTTYPFSLVFYLKADFGLKIQTPEAGTYTLSATYTEATTAPTEKFKEAVKQSGGGALIVNDDSGNLDKTWQEIFDAYTSGTAVVIRKETFTDNGGNGDVLVVNHSQVADVSTSTITTQGEEAVTYSVSDYSGISYDSTSADDYPSTNSGGGGGGGF